MLFDLTADIGEQHDLSARHPEKLAELRTLYQAWSDAVDADCLKLGLQPKFARNAPDKKKGQASPKTE
jgi:hypothetical protein